MDDQLRDDELMVLEAQREAEEAEMLLREAVAEAARIDEELAKLGISTSLLPLVSDKVDSSKEETPYWQDIEIKVTKSGENSTITEASTKADPKANDPPITPTMASVEAEQVSQNETPKAPAQTIVKKRTSVPFSKLAQTIPPVTRVNRSSNSINNSLTYLVRLPKYTKSVDTSSSTKPNIQPLTPVKPSDLPSKVEELVPEVSNTATAEPTQETQIKVEENVELDSIDDGVPQSTIVSSTTSEPSTITEISKATKSNTAPPSVAKATVPFSKLAETIPPVARVTATSKSVEAIPALLISRSF
jgi:hypothetical protein